MNHVSLSVINTEHDANMPEFICAVEKQYVKDEIECYMAQYPAGIMKTFITIDDALTITKYRAQTRQTIKFDLFEVNHLASGEYDFVSTAHELQYSSGYYDLIFQASFGSMKFTASANDLLSNTNMTDAANKTLNQMLQIGACIELSIVTDLCLNTPVIKANVQDFTVVAEQLNGY